MIMMRASPIETYSKFEIQILKDGEWLVAHDWLDEFPSDEMLKSAQVLHGGDGVRVVKTTRTKEVMVREGFDP